MCSRAKEQRGRWLLRWSREGEPRWISLWSRWPIPVVPRHHLGQPAAHATTWVGRWGVERGCVSDGAMEACGLMRMDARFE